MVNELFQNQCWLTPYSVKVDENGGGGGASEKDEELVEIEGFGKFALTEEGLRGLSEQAKKARDNQLATANKLAEIQERLDLVQSENELLRSQQPLEPTEDAEEQFRTAFEDNPKKAIAALVSSIVSSEITPMVKRELEPLKKSATLRDLEDIARKYPTTRDDLGKIGALETLLNTQSLVEFLGTRGYDIKGKSPGEAAMLIHNWASGKTPLPEEVTMKTEGVKRTTATGSTAESKLRDTVSEEEYTKIKELCKASGTTLEEYMKYREEGIKLQEGKKNK